MNATTLDLNGCPGVARADAVATASAGRLMASLPGGWDVELPPLGAVNVTAVGVGEVPAARSRSAFGATASRRGSTSRRRWRHAGWTARSGAASSSPRCAPWALRNRASCWLSSRHCWIRLAGLSFSDLRRQLLVPLSSCGSRAQRAGARCGCKRRRRAVVRGRSRTPRGTFVHRRRCVACVDDVARGALVDAVAGDVVVFDGVAHREAGDAPWSVLLALGGFRAPGRVGPDGRATIVRGWRLEKREDGTMEADERSIPLLRRWRRRPSKWSPSWGGSRSEATRSWASCPASSSGCGSIPPAPFRCGWAARSRERASW